MELGDLWTRWEKVDSAVVWQVEFIVLQVESASVFVYMPYQM